MRYTVRIFLFLIILGIIFVGCYLKLDSKTETEPYIGPHTVEALMKAFDARYSSTAAKWASETEEWIVIGETAVPKIPGVIYVQKTESTATIWYTNATTTSETGEIISVQGSGLSERQKLNLLNTGAVPRGWEVVYVDEDGSPIR